MKGIGTRALTGFFFIATILACVYLSQYSFVVLFLVIIGLAGHEFLSHTLDKNFFGIRCLLSVICSLIPAISLGYYMTHNDSSYVAFSIGIFLMVLVSVFILELFLKSEKPLQNIAFSLMAIIYAGIFISSVFYVGFKDGNYEPNLIFGILAITWSNDTFAYLFGSAFGKNKLFERISPNKTWEGTLGGVFMALVFSFVAYKLVGLYSLGNWLAFGAIISIIGTLGDLVESMFKRSLKIKDSGNILPGHGGILDRFDSIIIHLPILTAYIIFVTNF